jgi:proteasome assembly chaperone (PAC2) family protein
MKPAGDLPPRGHFDVRTIDVREGVITPPHLPRAVFYRAAAGADEAAPATRPPELIVFVGESQPDTGSLSYAHELLDVAQAMGVSRVVTFASLATQLHPSADPKVWGAVTHPSLLDELRRVEVNVLREGQIGGLNGVLLGACAQRQVPAIGLLGEIPFFAAGMPNPKTGKAVLDSFALLAGMTLELDELSRHAKTIETTLVELMERLQAEGKMPEFPQVMKLGPQEEPAEEPGAGARAEPPLSDADRASIERLFEAARADRARAMDLKRELDRLGVFKTYENRFLDLFRRAE